ASHRGSLVRCAAIRQILKRLPIEFLKIEEVQAIDALRIFGSVREKWRKETRLGGRHPLRKRNTQGLTLVCDKDHVRRNSQMKRAHCRLGGLFAAKRELEKSDISFVQIGRNFVQENMTENSQRILFIVNSKEIGVLAEVERRI